MIVLYYLTDGEKHYGYRVESDGKFWFNTLSRTEALKIIRKAYSKMPDYRIEERKIVRR